MAAGMTLFVVVHNACDEYLECVLVTWFFFVSDYFDVIVNDFEIARGMLKPDVKEALVSIIKRF